MNENIDNDDGWVSSVNLHDKRISPTVFLILVKDFQCCECSYSLVKTERALSIAVTKSSEIQNLMVRIELLY